MKKTKLGNSNHDFATCSIKTEMTYGSVKLRSAGDLDLTLGSRGYFFLTDADRSRTSEARVPGPLSSQEKPLDCTFLIDRLFITFREKK